MNYMDSNLIEGISSLVEQACAADTNRFGYGIWQHHIEPMVPIAQDLARQLGADQEIVTLAVLLHDYAGIADESAIKDHHIHGAAEADRILGERGYEPERTRMVKACILSHRGSVSGARETKEQQCVADADAIAHMEELPSLYFVAFANLGMGIDEGTRWVREKLERDWAKLSDTGRERARRIYETVRDLGTLLPGQPHEHSRNRISQWVTFFYGGGSGEYDPRILRSHCPQYRAETKGAMLFPQGLTRMRALGPVPILDQLKNAVYRFGCLHDELLDRDGSRISRLHP